MAKTYESKEHPQKNLPILETLQSIGNKYLLYSLPDLIKCNVNIETEEDENKKKILKYSKDNAPIQVYRAYTGIDNQKNIGKYFFNPFRDPLFVLGQAVIKKIGIEGDIFKLNEIAQINILGGTAGKRTKYVNISVWHTKVSSLEATKPYYSEIPPFKTYSHLKFPNVYIEYYNNLPHMGWWDGSYPYDPSHGAVEVIKLNLTNYHPYGLEKIEVIYPRPSTPEIKSVANKLLLKYVYVDKPTRNYDYPTLYQVPAQMLSITLEESIKFTDKKYLSERNEDFPDEVTNVTPQNLIEIYERAATRDYFGFRIRYKWKEEIIGFNIPIYAWKFSYSRSLIGQQPDLKWIYKHTRKAILTKVGYMYRKVKCFYFLTLSSPGIMLSKYFSGFSFNLNTNWSIPSPISDMAVDLDKILPQVPKEKVVINTQDISLNSLLEKTLTFAKIDWSLPPIEF